MKAESVLLGQPYISGYHSVCYDNMKSIPFFFSFFIYLFLFYLSLFFSCDMRKGVGNEKQYVIRIKF